MQLKKNFDVGKRGILLAVILFGSFLAILNQTLMLPALASIMHDMGVTANTVQWLTTGFMMLNGIMIPITAFLIERFSNRRLFIGAMGILTVGSLVCAFAPNFGFLLLGRLIQALSVGIIMPMMQTLIMYMYPKEKRGYAMGIQGIVIGFAPAIGPTLSGIIVDSWGWHYIFYIIIPLAVIDIAAAYFLMPNLTEKGSPRLDIPSIILSTIGCGGVLYGCSMAGSFGWGNPGAYIPILIGLAGLALFVSRQFKLEKPFLNIFVLKHKAFVVGTILAMTTFGLMISCETLLPLYVQNALGDTALVSGLVMLPGAVLMGIFSPIAGKLFDQFGPRFLALTGLLAVVASTLCLAKISLETSVAVLSVIYAFRLLGITMITMPMTTWGLNSLDNRLLAHGTSVNACFRQIFGSVITAVTVTVMTATQNKFINPESADAMLNGFQNAFLLSTILAALLLLLSYFMVHDYDGIAAIHREKNVG
ncbi:MAG: MDR family MFS transporter [Bacillota bacterium]